MMEENNKLYELTTKLSPQSYFVVAKHPTEAEKKLIDFLNESDYGFSANRVVTNIKLLATEHTDIRFVTNHFLITKEYGEDSK